MIFFVSLLFLYGLFISSRKSWCLLLIFIPFYTFLLLIYSVNSYFIDHENKYSINTLLFVIVYTYNTIFFIIAKLMYKKGIVGAVLFSVAFTALSCCYISIPLNPLILIYSILSTQFLGAPSPIFITLLLYFIPYLLFCKSSLKSKCHIAILLLFILFSLALSERRNNTHASDMKIAAIQVGLYFDMGGNTESFPLDIIKFLDKHRDVDLVVFSENALYGNRTEYNRKQTEKLIKILESHGEFDKTAFIFNFYGYKDINNIVSVFRFKNNEIINQKEALIPYVEKKGFFSYGDEASSEYFRVSPHMKKNTIFYNKRRISTFICFDALFPSFFSYNDIVIVQSNYNKLNKGKGYENTLRNGSLLGWFSHAMNSDLYVNVQDTGGSVIIKNRKGINNDMLFYSMKTPFIIIE